MIPLVGIVDTVIVFRLILEINKSSVPTLSGQHEQGRSRVPHPPFGHIVTQIIVLTTK